MLKKILSVSAVLMLVGCAAESKNEPFPGEFANADYVLSDENAKRWVVESHKAEQCIYPNLTRIQQQHFSKEDAYIHSQYVFFYPLEDVIGAEYVKIIQDDEKSMGYATHLFKKYKTLAFEPLNAKTCQQLRTKARDDLAVVKGQYKSGMVEENKSSNNKNPDGVATNENKFFFDIIKWGAALIL